MASDRRSKDIGKGAMLLLVFLLISAAVGQPQQHTVDGYRVKIDKGVLMRVETTDESSDTMDLSNFYVERLDRNCFEGLKSLKNLIVRITVEDELYSQNSLPPLVFRSLSNLEKLELVNLHGQDLRWVFWGLSKLQTLNLAESTVNLEKGSFFGLNSGMIVRLHRDNRLIVQPMHFLKPYSFVSVCTINGTVQAIESLDQMTETNGDCHFTYSPLRYETVILDSMGIKGFAKNWYRISDANVHRVTLLRNDIENVTSSMFNDLPKNVNEVYLGWNKIKTITRGKIANPHLRVMDFLNNPIMSVEPHAFEHTSLTKLVLSLEFTKTLPNSLQKVDISNGEKPTTLWTR